MYRNRFFRDPATGDDSGGTLTQEELDQQKYLQEQEDLKKEAYDGDTLKPGYILGLDNQIIKDTNYQPPVEGLNEDGTLQDGYEKDPEGNVVKIEVIDDSEEATSFYEAVHAITGRPIEVDYGTVDPISPEGVALRERFVRDAAIEEWDKNLRENNPRAYAYFLHTESGKPDEEFFEQKSFSVPDTGKLETSTDLQSDLVKRALVAKGVPEEAAQLTVESYIKANTLKEKALAIHKEYQDADIEQLRRLEDAQNKQRQEFDVQVKSVLDMVDNSIAGGNLRFVVPEAKQPEFATFVKERIQYNQDGNFYFTQVITPKDIKGQLESLFVQFNGGSLKDIVEKQATKLVAQRLRSTVQKDKATQTSGSEQTQSDNKYIPLGDI